MVSLLRLIFASGLPAFSLVRRGIAEAVIGANPGARKKFRSAVKMPRPKKASPSRNLLPARAVVVRKIRQEDPVSRILSCAVIPLGAASPRTLISDLPGGFGVLRTAAPRRAWHPRILQSRLGASGRCAAEAWLWLALPSLFGLAPCGVYPAPGVTVEAVRSYRTFSPLPRRDWPSRRT